MNPRNASLRTGPPWGTRASRLLRSARGAFDLPSIITGVVIVGILAAGVLAAIFGVIPFAQENGAKQDLAAVRTAEAVAKTKDGKFLDVAGLRSAGYLPSVSSAAASTEDGEFTRVADVNPRKPTFTVGVGPNGTCYVALSFSPGKVFYATDTVPEPRVLLTGKETGCLSLAEVEDLAATIDAPTSSAATPTGSPSATAVPASAPAVGTLASWGSNGLGQIGSGVTGGMQLGAADVKFATAPKVVSNVSASGTGNYSCATADDTAYCWGENAYGQLGNGTTTNSNVPVAVQGLLAGHKVSSVSAGGGFTCAIADTVGYCWGRNYYGQLTTGTTTDTKTPSKITGALLDKPLTKLSAGQSHACAISSDQVYCWGRQYDGRVGSFFTGGNQLTPLLVGGPLAGKKVTDISAGSSQTCAIADGQLYCWGRNSEGQLGNGTKTNTYTPTVVSGLLAGKTVTAVSAGGLDGNVGHTCAIADGAAYCWGADGLGRLGNGTGAWLSGPGTTVPVPMSNLAGKTVTSISTGQADSCVVADGVGYCAGDSRSGAIGDKVLSYSNLPVAVMGTKGPLLSISAGNNHSVAMYDSANPAPALPAAAALPVLASYQPGTLSGFGKDDYGQIGNNGGIIKNPSPMTINGLSNVTKVAAGSGHTCAISNDQAYCWGSNPYGQLGDGTATAKKTPVAVQGMAGKKVTDITVGYSFSCAVADGLGYCWGSDAQNQLGNGGTIANSSTAAPLNNTGQPMAGKTVTSISAGYQHACAVAEYRVYCWGYNNNGQNSVQNNFPAGYPGPVYGELARRNVSSVSAGYDSTCAIADGADWCWGSNYYGQLGINVAATADVREPTKVGGLLAGKTVSSISAGITTCAVADGAAYCWGRDFYGAVGNGRIDGATDVNSGGTPVVVNYITPSKVVDTGVLAGKTVTSIAASNDSGMDRHVCAVASGSAYCWGSGVNGELGNGALLNSDVPVAVTQPSGQVLTVSAGLHHTEMTSK